MFWDNIYTILYFKPSKKKVYSIIFEMGDFTQNSKTLKNFAYIMLHVLSY